MNSDKMTLEQFKKDNTQKKLRTQKRKLTFATSCYRDISRPTADIKYNWSLYPWYEKMCSLITHNVLHPLETIKYHRSVTTFDYCKKNNSYLNL